MQIPSVPPRLKVLIVDDDELTVTGLQRVLQLEHEVVAVTSASDALALVREGARFDVILCDLHMPVVSGMELHAALTGIAPELANRMVFSTGDTLSDSAQQFLRRLPNRHLRKPFGMRTLHETIRQIASAGGPAEAPLRSETPAPSGAPPKLG